MSLRELSSRLKQWRCERPDEWIMDEFIRLASALEYQQEQTADRIEAMEGYAKKAEALAVNHAKEAGELAARVSALEAQEDYLRAEAKEAAARIEAMEEELKELNEGLQAGVTPCACLPGEYCKPASTAPVAPAVVSDTTEELRDKLTKHLREALRYTNDNGKALGTALNIFDRAVRAAQGDAAPVPAKVPDGVARDAEIGAAIQRACGELQEGFNIAIDLEAGAGSVELLFDDGRYEPELDLSFAGQINDCIDAAIAEAQKEGKP